MNHHASASVMASRAPSLTDAQQIQSPPNGTAISAMNVVVRSEAAHNNKKGVNKKADKFRSMRKALHLCVGAKVILVLNQIWGVNTVPFEFPMIFRRPKKQTFLITQTIDFDRFLIQV